METAVAKIPGGISVDGLDLKTGKCGCTAVLPCCYSWSKVKRSGNTVHFTGKTTAPDTKSNFNWGYTVKKGDMTVEIDMEDARDKTIFSGYYPPRIEEWIEKAGRSCAGKGSGRTLTSGDALPASGRIRSGS